MMPNITKVFWLAYIEKPTADSSKEQFLAFLTKLDLCFTRFAVREDTA